MTAMKGMFRDDMVQVAERDISEAYMAKRMGFDTLPLCCLDLCWEILSGQ